MVVGSEHSNSTVPVWLGGPQLLVGAIADD